MGGDCWKISGDSKGRQGEGGIWADNGYVLIFSSCIRNLVPIKVSQGVSELCEISKV